MDIINGTFRGEMTEQTLDLALNQVIEGENPPLCFVKSLSVEDRHKVRQNG
jgi:hypothetical protein